jgi:hypothetical protein
MSRPTSLAGGRFGAVVLVALLSLALLPRAAAADATAFLGVNALASNRTARGFALGFGLPFLGFEFEYSSSSEDPLTGTPSLRSGSFNGLLQTPFEIWRMQLFATAGGGAYREVLGTAAETNVAVNGGGGVKIRLAGPIRMRLDYRVFHLSGAAVNPHPQRFYVGLNLRF